ncbi:LLM class flavin-dependent oxidoreductase [Saccharopolyspora phatthalungensis]|uniref:FMN-dependent oxidoreductase (Nitrilotriacetate monooxygenase family) n=1 Tax=Saccharopolyspora phatthalungensis TaxID=664693 RepID=A0A840QAB7_9PSEU|nr:LLM class flavin-dependent oxidoreductase [Saccharopolyspora phatthalungensis]MBB5159482.1 FMN-dependent oxidoreductase (nitrilotriacetate monooxygenase family) [Saccharopolyspora phatthalungensis]
MSSPERQLHLAAFVTAGPGRPGGWRHPDSVSDWRSAAYYQRIGRTLERAKFDLIFFADILAVPYRYGDSLDPQLRYGALGSMRLDPTPVLGTIAGVTEHLGLAATVSTTYVEPFAVARSFATLDHLSNGRSAWNIVTSFQDAEARNFGKDSHLDRAQRYRRAEEFLQVTAKLWDSWEDDALVLDPQVPVFADPERVHRVDHHGEWFDVQGPLNVARPPQGYPVLIQAGASPSGRDFAARWADVIFCSHASLDAAKDFYADIKGRAAAHGRDPGQIKILPAITPVVAETTEAAKEKTRRLADLVVAEAGLSTLSYHLDIDLAPFPHDEALPEMDVPGVQGHYEEVRELTEKHGMTLRELGKQYGGTHEGDFSGTPSEVADTLEQWFTEGGCDGFTVSAVYQPGAFDEFGEQVVPHLQKRGLFRTQYTGSTLRDNLGLDRPASGDWRKRAVHEEGR